MTKLLIALVAGTLASVGIAQTAPAPADTKASPDKAAATKSTQNPVSAATADKGHTQRAADQAAKAEGTGASAKEARRAASRENIKGATAGTAKGYTGAAADQAAKAAEAQKK